jgi:hypothetical protein
MRQMQVMAKLVESNEITTSLPFAVGHVEVSGSPVG